MTAFLSLLLGFASGLVVGIIVQARYTFLTLEDDNE